MKRISIALFLVSSFFLLNACGSSKKVASAPGKKDKTATVKNSDVQTLKYIAKYKKTAQQEMRDYGIPASITMAQGILESASGTSYLARYANNHFGIKCADNWDGPKVYKDDDHKNECFRKYKSASESFRDHSKFLAQRRRYAFLFRLPPTDYEAWAKGLKKAGYATDPSYPSKLIYLIEKYKLYELDEEVLKKMNIKEENIAQENHQNGREKIIYEVKPGETLYTIAKKFNIPVKEIKEMNNLVDFDIYEGQILVLKLPPENTENINTDEEMLAGGTDKTETGHENKPTDIKEKISREATITEDQTEEQKEKTEATRPKFTKKVTGFLVHTVQPQETLFKISQMYKVPVEDIVEANNLPDHSITVGQHLKIPLVKELTGTKPEEEKTEKETGTEPVSTETGTPEYHIVQPGETLYRIHVKYGISIEKLKKLNGLKNNTIRVGQKIKLR